MAQQGRIKVQRGEQQLTILIPVKKNIPVMVTVFLLALPWMLMLWFLVERSLLIHTIWYAKPAYLIAIGLWMIPGVIGSAFLTWIFFGRERILLTKEQLLVEKPLVFYNRRNYYENGSISALRVGQELYKARINGEWTDKSRTILQFNTPQKEVTFGRGVSPEEAEFILMELGTHHWLKPSQFFTLHQI